MENLTAAGDDNFDTDIQHEPVRLRLLLAICGGMPEGDFSAEEAVSLANDSIYGLAGAVWSNDINTAHKVAAAVRVGTMGINNYFGGDVTVPFGGFKQSGNGRDKSMHAFDDYTELKTT
jgi:hypothetical protein